MHRLGVASIVMVLCVLGGAPALAADRWTGRSTAQDAGSGLCHPLTFEVTIEGATIGGTATSPTARGSIQWKVAGRIDGASVNFDTLHRDDVPDGRLQQIRWIGRISGNQMQITQNGQSVSCKAPRTAVLSRS